MILDLSPLEKALQQLNKSLAYLDSSLAAEDGDLRDQFRAAAIQAFEYTYELGVKMLRRQLEQMAANPAEIRQQAFMDMVRLGAEAGLVKEVSPFHIYRDKRNMTSHTYDESKAEEVLAVMPQFVEDLQFLLTKLKERNHVDQP
ncbi:MAG: nucleotidyltransferase substrate binding protein [Geopsychrobacter sp.]|nr:nucleotidyltransferase substrate binding protein [Geopsychrobacter sp.]